MNRTSNIVINLLIKEIKSNDTLNRSFDFSRKQQKYELKKILEEIIYVLKTGISWRNIRSRINWISIYKRYIQINKVGIFKNSYKNLLAKYLKKGKNRKLKYISVDTTFIVNKKGKNEYGYNRYYGKKNGTKISIIVDSFGKPLDIRYFALR